MPSLQRARHGDFVCIFDIAAGRNPGCNAGDAHVERSKCAGDPACCCLAFEIGAGCQDYFIEIATLNPLHERARPQLIGSDAVQRRKSSMEHVVNTAKTAALDGINACRLFDNADQSLVTRGAGAIRARINVSDVIANGTEAKAYFESLDGFCQC